MTEQTRQELIEKQNSLMKEREMFENMQYKLLELQIVTEIQTLYFLHYF